MGRTSQSGRQSQRSAQSYRFTSATPTKNGSLGVVGSGVLLSVIEAIATESRTPIRHVIHVSPVTESAPTPYQNRSSIPPARLARRQATPVSAARLLGMIHKILLLVGTQHATVEVSLVEAASTS